MIKHYITNERTNTEMQLEIHEGFDNLDRMNSFIRKRTTFRKNSFAIIVFNKQYYAVATDGVYRLIIIGKEQIWYYKNKVLHQTNWRYFKEPYQINRLMKYIPRKNQIAKDLRRIDTNLHVVIWDSGQFEVITSKPLSDLYLNLLGRTFYNVYFDYEDYQDELKYYFDLDMLHGYFKSGVVAINPFHNKILMDNGNVTKGTF